MALQRLHQTLRHVDGKSQLSLLQGPSEAPLLDFHLGTLLDEQALKYGGRTALVSSAQSIPHNFSSLRERSQHVAKTLLMLGIGHGDMVGIFAGNRAEYAELFFPCGRIGAVLAVFNITYTNEELRRALVHNGKYSLLHFGSLY